MSEEIDIRIGNRKLSKYSIISRQTDEESYRENTFQFLVPIVHIYLIFWIEKKTVVKYQLISSSNTKMILIQRCWLDIDHLFEITHHYSALHTFCVCSNMRSRSYLSRTILIYHNFDTVNDELLHYNRCVFIECLSGLKRQSWVKYSNMMCSINGCSTWTGGCI